MGAALFDTHISNMIHLNVYLYIFAHILCKYDFHFFFHMRGFTGLLKKIM